MSGTDLVADLDIVAEWVVVWFGLTKILGWGSSLGELATTAEVVAIESLLVSPLGTPASWSLDAPPSGLPTPSRSPPKIRR